MSKTLIAIIVVAVTGGIVAAAYLFTRTDSSGELDALVREIRATGAPVTLADLDAFYDGGGGAAETGKTLATLLALIRHIGEDEELLVTTDVDPTMQIPQQMVNDTRRYFGEHRDIASRLHEIFADEPRVRYPADLTLGADTPLEHLAHIRGGTRLLAQEAMLAAIDADPDGAARSLTTAFRLADSLRDEPLVISQLVRIACLGIACAATEDVVNLTSFEPRQLRELEVRIGRIESDGNIAHALLGERVWGMTDVVEQGTSARPTSEVWREVLSQQNMDDSKFNSRDYLTTEVIRLTRDYGELIALGTIAPEDRLAAADTLEASINSRADDGNLLAKTLLPALVRTYEAENRLIAQMRCTRAGLAALRFGVEKSSPPTGLESLVPGYLDSVPVDPFTGSILRFRTVGSGFIVYSVGPNGLDDMGRPPPEGMRIVEAGDVAFRVLSTK